MRRILVLIAALLIAALAAGLTGCAPAPSAPTADAATGTPVRVGVAEFATVIAEPGVRIIDVRTPEEFADGHIEGAVNIPVQQADFATKIAALDPGATYAVYCRSGNRSQPAVAAMEDAGITAVYELESGTKGWTAAGQPLTR